MVYEKNQFMVPKIGLFRENQAFLGGLNIRNDFSGDFTTLNYKNEFWILKRIALTS